MDEQLGALSKMIVSGELRPFIEARVTEDFFPDEKYRRVYIYLLEHWKKFSSPADMAVVSRAFPTYKWITDDEQPSEYYIYELRRRRENSIYLTALQEAGAIYANDDEPDKHLLIRRILHEAIIQAKTETTNTRDTDITQSYEGILSRIAELRENPGHLRGITTGFDGIDYVTGGLQPEQFVIVTGIPKSGKSSFLLYMALHVHRAGKIPLFVGFEMSNREQEDRLTSLLSGISLTKIMNGQTTMQEWKQIRKAYADIKNMPSFLLSSDVTSGTTVSALQTKITEYQPDVLFIDGIYMMDTDRDPNKFPKGSPQALTDISRSLKRLAQTCRIPIVASTQSLVARARNGLNIASLGYTSAFGQDADLILGVERQPNSNYSKFHVMESRSGPRKDVYVEWDWNHGHVAEVDPELWTPQAKAIRKGEAFNDDGI